MSDQNIDNGGVNHPTSNVKCEASRVRKRQISEDSKTKLSCSRNWRGVSSSGHRGRHGRLVAVDWFASIQYTGSNRSAETLTPCWEPALISPTSFLCLPGRANEPEGKREMSTSQTWLYIEKQSLQPQCQSVNRLGKGEEEMREAWRFVSLERGKDGSTEERCRINTRPSTETRCYSRYARDQGQLQWYERGKEFRQKIGEVQSGRWKRAGKRTKS